MHEITLPSLYQERKTKYFFERMKFWRMMPNISNTCKLLSLAGGLSVVQAFLAELPAQFLTYVRSRNIQPNL